MVDHTCQPVSKTSQSYYQNTPKLPPDFLSQDSPEGGDLVLSDCRKSGKRHLTAIHFRPKLMSVEIGKKLISASLHEREKQVLQRMADGLTMKEIGLALALHPKTVQYWSMMARNRLNATTLEHAVAIAIRGDLIQ